LLERSPADAPYRADLSERVQRIDSMLAMQAGSTTSGAPVSTAGAAEAAPVSTAEQP